MHEQRSNDAKNAETTLVPTQATRRSSLPVEEMEPFYVYSQEHSTKYHSKKTLSRVFIHHRRDFTNLYTKSYRLWILKQALLIILSIYIYLAA